MSDPIGQWTQAAMPQQTVPLRRPTPGGPIVLPGQAPPQAPGVSPASGWNVLDPWARGAPGVVPPPRGGRTYIPPQGQTAPTQEDYLNQFLIAAGLKAEVPSAISEYQERGLGLQRQRLDMEALIAANTATYRTAVLAGQESERGATAAWRQEQEKRLWAQMQQTGQYQQAGLGQQYAQMQQTGAYQQQGLQQRWAEMEMQRQAQAASLAQRRREMGASIGQGIAGMQSQQWAQGMPYALPSGTMFAPGMGPGGPVSEMARRSGVSYTPPRLPKAPPPSRQQMEQWIDAAIAKFGQ